DAVSGVVHRFREGDRVYVDKHETEGVVLRDEQWGDITVPVLLDDPDLVIKASIDSLLKLD
ncbi:MAG: hypothetical protein ACWGQW_15205, partial [bacterium]